MSFPPPSIPNTPGLDQTLKNRGWQIISGRGADYGNLGGQTQTNGSSTYRVNILPVVSATHLVLVFANYNSANNLGENRGQARVKRKVWLEYLVGTGQESSETGIRIPVTFNGGQNWCETDCGGVTFSDPIPFEAFKGTPFFVRTDTHIQGDNYLMPIGFQGVGGTGPGGLNNGDGYTNPTPTGEVGTTTQGLYNSDGPVAVLGYVNYNLPSAAILGDSRVAASFDSGWTRNFGGYPVRALSGQMGRIQTYPITPLVPHVKLSRAGETLAVEAAYATSQIRMKLMELASTAWLEGGINDLGPGLTSLQANAVLLANRCLARGQHVIRDTLLPLTTSTDGWKTVTNQTVGINESVRTAFNTWLRNGSFAAATNNPSMVSIFDAAAAIEVNKSNVLTLNGGFWPAAQSTSILTGTLTAASTSVLTDSTKSWTQDQYRGYSVRMTSGAASGQGTVMYSNSATQLNVASSLTISPSAGDAYEIYDPFTVDGIHPTSIGYAQIAAAFNINMVK